LKIILDDAREIFLNSICQSHTYEGLLAGYPDKEMNDRFIKDAMVSALKKMSAEATYLVPPFSLEVEVHARVKKHYKDAIRIPYITCYGQFESSVIKGDDVNDASCLTIVWYQDEFSMPIDESILEHIKTIDWDGKAEGYQF
jgi:hypothetical protein